MVVALLFFAVTVQAADRPIAWTPVGLSGGGGMFTPAISPADPNLMMLNCDMSAAYVSEDGGRNWRMIHHAQLRSDTACRPAFHPTDPNIIYASSGGRLRISRDRGRTFAPHRQSQGIARRRNRHQSATIPRIMLAGSRSGALLALARCGRDLDGVPGTGGPGDRVSLRSYQPGPRDVCRHGPGHLAFRRRRADLGGEDPGPAVEGDSGFRRRLGCGEERGRALLLDAQQGRRTACSGAASTARATAARPGNQRWAAGSTPKPKQADQWAYGPIAQYKQLLTTDAKPLTVYALNTSTGFHPPHSDTVYRSDDGGETWRATYFQDPRFKRLQRRAGLRNRVERAVLQGRRDAVRRGHLQHRSRPRDPGAQRTAHHPRRRRHAGSAGTPIRRPARSPARLRLGLQRPGRHHDLALLHRSVRANRHYIAYTDIGLARSLDGGKTWIWWDQKSWAPWRNTCYEMAFDPEMPGKIWGAFSDVHDIPNDNIISERHGHRRPGGVCVSRDFGASWKAEAQGLPPKPVTSIVLDPRSPKNARTLYAGVFDEGVFKSTDDGKTWTLKKTGLGHPDNMRVYRVILHRDGTLFAVICAKRPAAGQPLMSEGVGLYRSRDGAETWEKINASQPLLYPQGLLRPSRATAGGSCWAPRMPAAATNPAASI